MISTSKTLSVGLAWLAAVALPLSSHAATVTWGTIQTLTGSTNIVSTGVTSLAGANFGITTGTEHRHAVSDPILRRLHRQQQPDDLGQCGNEHAERSVRHGNVHR